MHLPCPARTCRPSGEGGVVLRGREVSPFGGGRCRPPIMRDCSCGRPQGSPLHALPEWDGAGLKPLPRPLPTGEGSSAKGKFFANPHGGNSSRGGTPPLLWREPVPMYREGWGERFCRNVGATHALPVRVGRGLNLSPGPSPQGRGAMPKGRILHSAKRYQQQRQNSPSPVERGLGGEVWRGSAMRGLNLSPDPSPQGRGALPKGRILHSAKRYQQQRRNSPSPVERACPDVSGGLGGEAKPPNPRRGKKLKMEN
jgi:hypothetical protein